MNGAGNCYASGYYSEGSEYIEEIMEKVRKAVEKCNSIEGFNLTHSIGGGTGSGLGARVIKEIKGEFYDKMMTVYSICPSVKVSDIVVEPYNSLLCMNHMIEECDLNILIDNEALYDIV